MTTILEPQRVRGQGDARNGGVTARSIVKDMRSPGSSRTHSARSQRGGLAASISIRQRSRSRGRALAFLRAGLGVAMRLVRSRREFRWRGDRRRDGVVAGPVIFVDDEPVPVGRGPLSTSVDGGGGKGGDVRTGA